MSFLLWQRESGTTIASSRLVLRGEITDALTLGGGDFVNGIRQRERGDLNA